MAARGVLIASVLLISALAPAAPATADSLWCKVQVFPCPHQAQPGEASNACTLNFFFESTTNSTRYVALPKHCVDEEHLGEDEVVESDGPLGEVAWTDPVHDVALVRIYDHRTDITPHVRQWTGPTGIATADDVDYGDRVCLYGWGQVFMFRNETRRRCGRVEIVDNDGDMAEFDASIPGWVGDSGAPVIHYETGRALGMVTSGTPLASSGGPTTCAMLHRYATHGFDLSLMTASYDPPYLGPYPSSPVDEAPLVGFGSPCPEAGG